MVDCTQGINQLFRLQGLFQKAQRIALKALNSVFLVACHKDNAHALIPRANGVGGLDAVHATHFHINKERIKDTALGVVGVNQCLATLKGLGLNTVFTAVRKIIGEHLDMLSLVITNGKSHDGFPSLSLLKR